MEGDKKLFDGSKTATESGPSISNQFQFTTSNLDLGKRRSARLKFKKPLVSFLSCF